jgi:hypothetical protein
MNPNEISPQAKILLTHKTLVVSEHNGSRIVTEGLLPPIKTDADHTTLFRKRTLDKDMVLSGINNDASIRFVATNLFNATFEIRDINISIVRELLLRACSLTLINCRINASNVDEGIINVCEKSFLKLVDCEVNNCKISIGTKLTEKDAPDWHPTPARTQFLNSCILSNCILNYTLPSIEIFPLEVQGYSQIVLETCKVTSLMATTSSLIRAYNCSFERIAITKTAGGIFTKCQIKGTATAKEDGRDAVIRKASNGTFINCQIRGLTAYKDSQVFFIDSSVESVTAYLSQINIKNTIQTDF